MWKNPHKAVLFIGLQHFPKLYKTNRNIKGIVTKVYYKWYGKISDAWQIYITSQYIILYYAKLDASVLL